MGILGGGGKGANTPKLLRARMLKASEASTEERARALMPLYLTAADAHPTFDPESLAIDRATTLGQLPTLAVGDSVVVLPGDEPGTVSGLQEWKTTKQERETGPATGPAWRQHKKGQKDSAMRYEYQVDFADGEKVLRRPALAVNVLCADAVRAIGKIRSYPAAVAHRGRGDEPLGAGVPPEGARIDVFCPPGAAEAAEGEGAAGAAGVGAVSAVEDMEVGWFRATVCKTDAKDAEGNCAEPGTCLVEYEDGGEVYQMDPDESWWR